MRHGGVTTALSQSLDDLLTPASAMSSSLSIHIFSCLVTSHSPPRLVFCLSPHAPSSHLHSSALYAYLILATSPSVFYLSILAPPPRSSSLGSPCPSAFLFCNALSISFSLPLYLVQMRIQLCYKSSVTLFPQDLKNMM